MVYTQITREQRFKIESWLEADMDIAEISNRLNKDMSSVTREITRNGYMDGRYHASHADNLARRRRKAGRRSSKKLVKNPALRRAVIGALQRKKSPEQIAGRRKRLGKEYVAHETLYQYIYTEAPHLRKLLRQKKGKYRRRNGTKDREKRREMAKKRWFSDRPQIINDRSRIGDWEGDTIKGILGTTSALVTNVERVSGYALVGRVNHANTEEVNGLTDQLFKRVPSEYKLTITYDNGSEFDRFEQIEKMTGLNIYFALPYHSWERPCNENFNGLMREFFPKKTDFATVSKKDVAKAVRMLNHRPRKRLSYLTPYEVFVKGMNPNITCTSN